MGRHVLRRPPRARLAAAGRALLRSHVEAPEAWLIWWALIVLTVLVIAEAVL